VPVEVDATALQALELVSAQDSAVLLPRPRQPHALDGYLAERGLDDAIVAALHGADGVLGLVAVGNRSGDVATFTKDDRKLFETFASHAGVLLENDRVKEQLRHQAFHDALTGLPNRVLFAEQVRGALGRAASAGLTAVVLFVDLDDFKTINDTMGHGAGDQVLVAVAERIRASVRPTDVAARLGGDEFAILLDVHERSGAELVAGRILDALRAPFVVEGREVPLHASIGIADAGEADNAEELMRNADVAMYSAKTNDKGGHAWYEPEMHVRIRRRQELAGSLEHAIERGEIDVHYQPIVALASSGVVAVEALARWHHPVRGLLPPDTFIPLAEETGLMPEIGAEVLRRACEQLRTWSSVDRAHEDLAVAVNLSLSELRNPDLVAGVERVLAETGLAPERLILEITETIAMENPPATIGTLTELRRLGVRLALDDFGTGYSSLSHLRDFPIDILKIAKPFVDRIARDGGDGTFVDAILRLADALDLDVVAEGIERRDQVDALRRVSCGLGQGFYFSRPVDAVEMGARLVRAKPRRRPKRRLRVA
jgi:diguanylate cyclase (GGDEF)-like protein